MFVLNVSETEYPNLHRWFAAMETRPAYRNFKADDYSHVRTLPPQIGPCKSSPDAAPFREKIEKAPENAVLDSEFSSSPLLPPVT